MSLLAFFVACGIGATVGLAARPHAWIGRLTGLVCLLLAFAAALLIGPTTRLSVGDVTLAGSDYSGLFLACTAGSGLVLCIVALTSGWPGELPPAALASFAGLAVALTAADPGVALLAGACAATAGALVIVRATPRLPEADGRLAEIRTIALVAVGLGFAVIVMAHPAWTGPSEGVVVAPAFLGMGLALAVRSGAVPFHVPAAHLRNTAVPMAPALLLVWIPAGLGILAVSWSATTAGTRSEWLNAVVAIVQVVAVATLVLGPLAALVSDDIGEVVAYSIVGDASFVLLAMAARTGAATEPARLWLLVFIVAKTALVVWGAALSRAFGTTQVPRLRGWLRRAPTLGLALVVVVVATLGWPGSPVYGARSTLISLALPGELQFLFAASIVLSLAYPGRLLALGVLSPSEEVRVARSELPRWPAGQPNAPQADSTSAPASSGPAAEAASPSQAAAELTPAGEAPAGPAPARRSTRRRASRAAGEAPPTTAAAVSVEAGWSNPAGPAGPGPEQGARAGRETDGTAGGAAGIPGGPARARSEFGRNVAAAWRLNRTLQVSLMVLGGAVVSVVLAFGGLGSSNAARFGIPLDTAARATPARPTTSTPASVATATPLPTPAPRPTGGPSGPTAPSGPVPPTSSPGPGKTSAPARGNSD